MRIHSVLILALTTVSFAFPTELVNEHDPAFNESLAEHRLEKRATYGWVAAYADSDPHCQGKYALPRPKVRSHCVKFTPVESVIGINWGTSLLAYDVMTLYTNDKCGGPGNVTIKAPKHHHRKGPQTCYAIQKGVDILSVMGTSNTR